MQTGILPMPQASGLPLRRQIPVSTRTLLKVVDSDSNFTFNEPSDITSTLLGSDITKSPNRLFKVIHICPSRMYVLETVFSLERDVFVCLYTKVIGIKTKVLISLNGINSFKNGNNSVKPLSLLVSEKYWRKSRVNLLSPSTFIVDAIFDFETLNDEVLKIIDQIETGGMNTEKHEVLSSLHQEAPHVLNALSSGSFHRSPFNEIRTFHPYSSPQEDKWFLQSTSIYNNRVKDGVIHFNQQEFDFIVHRLVSLRPNKLSVSLSITHALEGLLDLGILKNFSDPYSDIFGSVNYQFEVIKNELKNIFFHVVFIYCQIYDIDYQVFTNSPDPRSIVCIDKNIYDEVTIEFYDHVNNRHVTFYSYYPLVALGTWGVGEELNYTRG